MQDRYFDDVRLGERWFSEPILVSEDAIMEFGLTYDPQPFHTDAELAKAGPFGALVASGWHLAALAMKAFASSKPYGNTPIVGMGVDELRWLSPVRAGDVIVVQREIVAKKDSISHPDKGILRTSVQLVNQEGAIAMRFIAIAQMSRKRMEC